MKRRGPASCVALGALAFFMASMRPASANAWAPADESTSYASLMAKAEQERAGQRHTDAARTYREAYYSLSEDDKINLLGEITLDNALADYRKAREQQPKEIAVVEEPLVLLDEFISARAKAHEAGAADPVPERMEQERAQLAELAESLRPEPEPVAKAESPTILEDSHPVAPKPIMDEPPPSRALGRLGWAGVGLVAGGVVGLVTGITMTAIGTRMQVSPDDSAQLVGKDYSTPGVPTLIVGGGLLSTGIVFLLFDRRRARKRMSRVGGGSSGLVERFTRQRIIGSSS